MKHLYAVAPSPAIFQRFSCRTEPIWAWAEISYDCQACCPQLKTTTVVERGASSSSLATTSRSANISCT
eukprot:1638322-Pleurochrysis_carterae.AAC.1